MSERSGRGRGPIGWVLVMVTAMVAAVLGAPAPAGATDRAPQLRISSISVECECGGAGYLWGWRGVYVQFRGARADHAYQVAVRRGPTVDATAYSGRGGVLVTREDAGFRAGKVYRFQVRELDGPRVVRATDWARFRIPEPVGHPDRIHLDAAVVDGRDVLVAGETYHLTFDGSWAPGARFASGVDRYRGIADGDDRFGWYGDEGYPLPWESRGTEPILELTPTEEFVGTEWHVLVVGYLPSPTADRRHGIRKGDPIPGSEWGFWFAVPVVSAAEAAGGR